MKFTAGVVLALVLNGCASTPSTPSTAGPQAPAAPPAEAPDAAAAPAAEESEAEPEPAKPSAAEEWADRRSREELAAAPPPSDSAASADPLAIGDAMESATTTKIDITPAKQLRPKTIRDLEDGRKIAENAQTYEEAVQKLGTRLGKPTWIENGKKYVWVVRDSAHCYRLVLDADGSIETETVGLNETRMISALSQQNACTGVVVNGVPGMKH